MKPDHLEEQFFQQIALLFDAKCSLQKRQQQFKLAKQSLERISNVLNCNEQEFNESRQELNTLTFDLMLHTPCYKFAKLSGLLDL